MKKIMLVSILILSSMSHGLTAFFSQQMVQNMKKQSRLGMPCISNDDCSSVGLTCNKAPDADCMKAITWSKCG